MGTTLANRNFCQKTVQQLPEEKQDEIMNYIPGITPAL